MLWVSYDIYIHVRSSGDKPGSPQVLKKFNVLNLDGTLLI